MNKIAQRMGNPFKRIAKPFEWMNKIIIVQQTGKPFKHD